MGRGCGLRAFCCRVLYENQIRQWLIVDDVLFHLHDFEARRQTGRTQYKSLEKNIAINTARREFVFA